MSILPVKKQTSERDSRTAPGYTGYTKKEDADGSAPSKTKTNPKQCFTKKIDFGFAQYGGPGGIRTLDLSDANRTLSQLSYRPIFVFQNENSVTLLEGFVKDFSPGRPAGNVRLNRTRRFLKNDRSFIAVCVFNAQATAANCISQRCRFDRHYF